MRKTTKALLSAALVMFIAGALLSLGSFIFIKVKGIDPYGVEQIEKTEKTFSLTCKEISKSSPNSSYKLGLKDTPFSQINFKLYAGNIEIRETDKDSYIDFENVNISNVSYSVDGEVLIIKENNTVGVSGIFIGDNGISYKGLRQIIGPGRSASKNQKITLNLNPNDKIYSVLLNINIGNIYISDLTADQMSIKSTKGFISVSDSNIASKLSVSGDFSNIDLNYNFYSSSNISSKFGDVNVYIPETESSINTVVDGWMGNINIYTDIPTSYFKLDFSSQIGNASKNGEICGRKFDNSSNLTSRITVSEILGDVSLKYTGENESDYVPKNIIKNIEIIDSTVSQEQTQQ